jgi:hypothetical protein
MANLFTSALIMVVCLSGANKKKHSFLWIDALVFSVGLWGINAQKGVSKHMYPCVRKWAVKTCAFLCCFNCCIISIKVIGAVGLDAMQLQTMCLPDFIRLASLHCERSSWWKWGIPKGGNDLCCKHKELAGFLGSATDR